MGDAADVSEVHDAPIFRVKVCRSVNLKIGTDCNPEMLATSPTTTWCNTAKTELRSIINQYKSLKSVKKYVNKNG
jgi:hypothetical protein